MKLAAITAIAVLAGMLAAAAAQPVKQERSYEAEKARLIGAGYEPVKISDAPFRNEACAEGLCNGYPELESCEKNSCTFVFRRRSDDTFLLVTAMKGPGRVLRVKPPVDYMHEQMLVDYSSPPYADVRAQLIAQGYRPLRLPRAAEEDHANISDAMRKAYPEAVHCWGTEMSGCLMTFIKDGRYWTVRTYGEAPQHQSAIRPIARADVSDIEMIESRLARGKK